MPAQPIRCVTSRLIMRGSRSFAGVRTDAPYVYRRMGSRHRADVLDGDEALSTERRSLCSLRSTLVRLAARLIVEKGLEGEAADALGREYYVRGATPGAGFYTKARRP
jgi:hypothetical protein